MEPVDILRASGETPPLRKRSCSVSFMKAGSYIVPVAQTMASGICPFLLLCTRSSTEITLHIVSWDRPNYGFARFFDASVQYGAHCLQFTCSADQSRVNGQAQLVMDCIARPRRLGAPRIAHADRSFEGYLFDLHGYKPRRRMLPAFRVVQDGNRHASSELRTSSYLHE
jgi:hypothetical protein